MIIDELTNACAYFALGARLERALRFLQVMDGQQVPLGRHEIAGDQVFALVQEYTSKPLAAGIWEAHRKYLDVQYVVAGVERLGYAPVTALEAGPYDAEKDYLPLAGNGQFVRLAAGQFAVLMPHDAHMPGMEADGPQPVRKVVVKVRV